MAYLDHPTQFYLIKMGDKMASVMENDKSFYMDDLSACLSKLRSDTSPEARLLFADKICKQFNEGAFTNPAETYLVSEILWILSKDIEVKVRKALSEQLKHNTKLPHDIALNLF